MPNEFWNFIAFLTPLVIIAALVGLFVWFVVSLVRLCRCDKNDAAARKKWRFMTILSGALSGLSIASIVAVIFILASAVSHM